jgi:hypothetical protein
MQQLLLEQQVLLQNSSNPPDAYTVSRLAMIQTLKANLAATLGPSGVGNVSAAMQKYQMTKSFQPGKEIDNAVYRRGPFTLELEMTAGALICQTSAALHDKCLVETVYPWFFSLYARG